MIVSMFDDRDLVSGSDTRYAGRRRPGAVAVGEDATSKLTGVSLPDVRAKVSFKDANRSGGMLMRAAAGVRYAGLTAVSFRCVRDSVSETATGHALVGRTSYTLRATAPIGGAVAAVPVEACAFGGKGGAAGRSGVGFWIFHEKAMFYELSLPTIVMVSGRFKATQRRNAISWFRGAGGCSFFDTSRPTRCLLADIGGVTSDRPIKDSAPCPPIPPILSSGRRAARHPRSAAAAWSRFHRCHDDKRKKFSQMLDGDWGILIAA
jgi:hypothetical protein